MKPKEMFLRRPSSNHETPSDPIRYAREYSAVKATCPRFVMDASSTAASCIQENAEALIASPSNDSPGLDSSRRVLSQHGAKGGGESDTPDRASPLGAAEKPKRHFEPLIGSSEAAKLLGNIHVKTLQRYARRGSLPGYQIGGHWYFRVSELDAWLQLQINSHCQSVR